MSQEDLCLISSKGKKWFENSQTDLTDLKATFKSCEVARGKWILYKNPDYNGSGGSADDIVELFKTTIVPIDLPFNPLSIRRLHDSSDSVEVFEHFYYGGTSERYEEPCPDLTDKFPAKDPEGVSSIIIWPNKSWELCTEKGYNGVKSILKEGKYETPQKMGFGNDTLKSLRPC